jgi:hypothetical protein
MKSVMGTPSFQAGSSSRPSSVIFSVIRTAVVIRFNRSAS